MLCYQKLSTIGSPTSFGLRGEDPHRHMSAAARFLLVWDFDWSLIDENSDTYVIERLDQAGLTWQAAQTLMANGKMGWTELMDWCLGKLHEAGNGPDAIANALKTAPIKSGALAAVSTAHAAGVEQRILSDANTVYIQTILNEHDLAGAFSQVVTNPATYDAAGRLRVRPHQSAGHAHGCPLCPPNLCKGAVLTQWINEVDPVRCVYVGDGGGDYCPAARLRAGDLVLARRPPHDSLLKRCCKEPVAATVLEWGGASDEDGTDLLTSITQAFAPTQTDAA